MSRHGSSPRIESCQTERHLTLPRFAENPIPHGKRQTFLVQSASAQPAAPAAYLNIVFDAGRYAPANFVGQRLLAHELTHVLQQKSTIPDEKTEIGQSDDAYEQEADRVSETVVQPQAAGRRRSGGTPLGDPLIQRGRGDSNSVSHLLTVPAIQRQPAGAGGAAPASHRFAAEGVNVLVRGSCAPTEFAFANVEAGTRTALNAIFNTTCIEESRRTRMQRNLTAHGLDIRCRRSANLQTPGACAESTGFFIPANIFTLGSSSFAGHPDSNAGCQPLESTILHEIVHLTRGFARESLPASCEASCFGAGGGDPTLCRDIDVLGNRPAP